MIAQANEDQTIQNFYAYTPYGETQPLAPDDNNPIQYTARENDATGLYYYRARYYDPVLKRFIQEDPIGLNGGLNVYLYADANPLRFVDPSGYVAGVDDLVLAGGGALIGIGIQGVTDLLEGHLSDWQHYAGAAFGGAVGGLAIEYTGGVGTGALAAGTTNGVTQALEVLSGKQCSFDFGNFALTTALGGAFGALPVLAIPGVSAGRNNWNAIGRTIRTKLTNGTIDSVSGMTAAKSLLGANVAGAYGGAAGIGATVTMDAMKRDKCGCR